MTSGRMGSGWQGGGTAQHGRRHQAQADQPADVGHGIGACHADLNTGTSVVWHRVVMAGRAVFYRDDIACFSQPNFLLTCARAQNQP